ncbi:hypothetical protein V1281_005495 [Nitrobacteraceae bacterium AZCC 2161]
MRVTPVTCQTFCFNSMGSTVARSPQTKKRYLPGFSITELMYTFRSGRQAASIPAFSANFISYTVSVVDVWSPVFNNLSRVHLHEIKWVPSPYDLKMQTFVGVVEAIVSAIRIASAPRSSAIATAAGYANWISTRNRFTIQLGGVPSEMGIHSEEVPFIEREREGESISPSVAFLRLYKVQDASCRGAKGRGTVNMVYLSQQPKLGCVLINHR